MVTPVKTKDVALPGRVAAYFAGSVLGGFTIGIVLLVGAASLGWVSDSFALGLLMVVGLYGTVADVSGRKQWLPGPRRQVPQSVALGGVPGAFQFGFEMGTGVRTYMPVALPLVLAVAVMVGGIADWVAVVSGIAFGAARGSLHLLKWYSRNPTWQASLETLSRTRISAAGSIVGIGLVLMVAVMRSG